MVAEHKTDRVITVSDVSLSGGNRINVKFSVTNALKRYFYRETSSATYDTSLTGLRNGLLVVPFLSLILPVAWVLDARVEVKEVDSAFMASMGRVRRRFQRMYPEVAFGGELVTEKTTTSEQGPSEKRGVLFSGGIDSHASAIYHRHEPLVLMSVISDRDTKRGFADWITRYNPEFASMIGKEHHVVRADAHQLFDAPLVCSHVKQHIDDWWSNIQHSLYFTGACAPLASRLGIGRFYVPSTHSIGSEAIRWGSHPKIDNEIAWGDTRVSHDLYDFSRQKKVSLIAKFLRESGVKPTICVCEMMKDVGGKNCSKCEKCSRSIVGLALEGLDPNDFGFKLDPGVLANIQRRIKTGRMVLNHNELHFWQDLQRLVKERTYIESHGFPEFAEWFRETTLTVDRGMARKLELYRRLVHISGSLPSFLRRPLRDAVLHMRKIPH